MATKKSTGATAQGENAFIGKVTNVLGILSLCGFGYGVGHYVAGTDCKLQTLEQQQKFNEVLEEERRACHEERIASMKASIENLKGLVRTLEKTER